MINPAKDRLRLAAAQSVVCSAAQVAVHRQRATQFTPNERARPPDHQAATVPTLQLATH
ncbi:hypothetical protein ABFU51_22125 [Xanthomonas campestris pv. raphani]|uniref:hypothetical protein n=1 Tax=Xanthomonas campestris TaxID=339 RepID=UPI00388FE518